MLVNYVVLAYNVESETVLFNLAQMGGKKLNYNRNIGRVWVHTTDSRYNGHHFPDRFKSVT